MFAHINEISILVAALLSVAVGSIWYSPLVCGTIWLRASGKTDLEVDYSKRELIWVTVSAVGVHIIFFFLLAYVSTVLQTTHALLTTVAIVTGVIILNLTSIALWEGRSLLYVVVHGGYMLLTSVSGLSVITYWPW